MLTSHKLTSCTKQIETAKALHGGHCLVLVDTPGFDDTHESDVVILKRIADWLKNAYNSKACIGGIIYLHDISNNRFSGSARQNLQVFNSMCGEAAFRKVVFGTTHWDDIDKSIAKIHLKGRSMLSSGASVCNLELTPASAFGVIETIIQKQAAFSAEHGFGQSFTCPDAGMTIQKEMAVQKKSVQETKAAKSLRTTLKEIVLLQKQMLAIEEMEALGEVDGYDAKRRHLERLADQVQALRVSLPKRLRSLLPF
ncbi:hypothetical protein JR316_0002987 [Psilocybe cubensis]|uniref:Uncharacterized protein n=2 Tax=Psilocybe cubensis TaxID=181762 RepID=A0ACB8H6R4_PSICU|nr:hypothetical protein JR316_0002987 [Psilocybe cubensis]KAH9483519.1 hypothetical protein JR316_0002987 [Psilocybe cubensis]